MSIAAIKSLQSEVGTIADGVWGEKSKAACKLYLRQHMPAVNPWPESTTLAMTRFYGKAGDESNLVNLPVADLGIFYEGAPVKTIRCHAKVAASLRLVLDDIAGGPYARILRNYAGCYNYRPMRGGTSMSMHAWGAAIDLDPDPNANATPWPTTATMPLGVMIAFAKQGWLPAGAFWGRDAMHFQATR